MPAYAETIRIVKQAIQDTFEEVYPWFRQPVEVLGYKPADGGWSIAEILEHITLTSHFLLIVAKNGCAKALKRAQSQPIHDSESDLVKLAPIGEKGSFPWIRPEHMEPQGKAMAEVLHIMRAQELECEAMLDALGSGQGSLFKVRMSVNDLGKVDLYQWIYFIAQHARRHLTQMEENLAEWREATAQKDN